MNPSRRMNGPRHRWPYTRKRICISFLFTDPAQWKGLPRTERERCQREANNFARFKVGQIVADGGIAVYVETHTPDGKRHKELIDGEVHRA